MQYKILKFPKEKYIYLINLDQDSYIFYQIRIVVLCSYFVRPYTAPIPFPVTVKTRCVGCPMTPTFLFNLYILLHVIPIMNMNKIYAVGRY